MSEHRVAQLEDRVGDLIARQGRGRDAAELTRYAADPVAFATEVLDFTPWSAQREMLAAVCDRPLVAVVGANAVGKDAALAALALWWVYACGGLVLLVSASQRQTSEILMRGEVSRLFRAGRLPGTLYTESLRLPDERAAIIAFTTSEMSRLGGYHGARLLVGVSEAQGVEDWAFEALLGCAVGQEDRVCLVGNAFFNEGLFFRAFRSNTPWTTLRIPATAHPNLTHAEPPIAGGPTPAGIERLAAEYGPTSPAYQARVDALFPTESAEALCRRVWCDRAAERWERGELRDPRASVFIAVDPARYGPDSTCVVVRRGPRVEEITLWSGCDLMATVAQLEVLCGRWHVRPRWQAPPELGGAVFAARGYVIVDEVGLGGGVLDRLTQLRYPALGFNGGRVPTGSTEQERFANERSAAYWRLRTLFEQGEIAVPRDDKLFDELAGIRWKPTPAGKVQLESKDDLRVRLGRSSDRSDALSMAFSAVADSARRPGGFKFVL